MVAIRHKMRACNGKTDVWVVVTKVEVVAETLVSLAGFWESGLAPGFAQI